MTSVVVTTLHIASFLLGHATGTMISSKVVRSRLEPANKEVENSVARHNSTRGPLGAALQIRLGYHALGQMPFGERLVLSASLPVAFAISSFARSLAWHDIDPSMVGRPPNGDLGKNL
jgi:hypothetical protein